MCLSVYIQLSISNPIFDHELRKQISIAAFNVYPHDRIALTIIKYHSNRLINTHYMPMITVKYFLSSWADARCPNAHTMTPKKEVRLNWYVNNDTLQFPSTRNMRSLTLEIIATCCPSQQQSLHCISPLIVRASHRVVIEVRANVQRLHLNYSS